MFAETEKPTILIVDDDPMIRKLLEHILRREPYRLAMASDGQEALTIAADLVPDVIILDVMMPGINGLSVCRQLRTDPILAEVPIIMLTSLEDKNIRLEALEAGADDFLSKPFDQVELRARLKSITRLNRYRQLRVERARFAGVIEQANDGYLIINDGGKILYTNSKARFYLDLPPDSTPNLTFIERVDQLYSLHPSTAWENWPEQTTEHGRYLVQPETPTAKAFWLQVNILDAPTGPDKGQVVHLRDVTDQMISQRDMRGFHTLVTHKLRTPLLGMVTGLELIANQAEELPPQEVRKYANIAVESVYRLQKDMDTILHYLRAPGLAEPGQELALDQLTALIQQISQDLALPAVTITGIKKLASQKLPLSRQATEWILREILQNAKKFHPQQNPTVEITVSALKDNQICLQVTDDGITLSQQQLALVWNPYYQGEKSFTGESSGMGLGLSMVAALVWSVGGSCRLYNRTDGPGVTVALTLPASKNLYNF